MVEATQQKPKTNGKAKPVDLSKKYQRKEVEDLLKRKFFITPSFEIYGGVSGFYDFGPLGSALKQNVEQMWRNHFVLEEDMLEVTCSNLVLSDVLKTSGHVDKFADYMVKDKKTGTCRRADKLIEEHIAKILPKKKKQEEKDELEKIAMECENYTPAEIDAVIAKLKIKDPDTGNDLSNAEEFNLMFKADIGPTGHLHGYLRPETAQGIFINFRRLIEFNNGRMPFAAAQIGMGFRNEISPRQGLLRVREFTMAEIEYFVDPENKNHAKFSDVSEEKLPLWTAATQEENSKELITDLTIGEAITKGLVGNETMGYFMTRTYQFLLSVGIRAEAIRFRQHRSNEMAHYANDCWDAEVETSYGWIEVAGHSDRSAFDLTRHEKKTKVELNAGRPLKNPIQVTSTIVSLDKKVCGKEFKRDQALVVKFFEEASADEKKQFAAKFAEDKALTITVDGKEFNLTDKHISFSEQTKTVMEEKYTPHVIEPSFGIGRIIYCMFEHCFKVREQDAQRTYFDFPALVSPVKCSLLPLMNQPDMNAKVREIKRLLIAAGVSSKVDDSGQSVGKRYARTDECGIPFAITVDLQTVEDNTVTVRELDSTKQVRLPIADLASSLLLLSSGQMKWAAMVEKYGLYEQAKEDAE